MPMWRTEDTAVKWFIILSQMAIILLGWVEDMRKPNSMKRHAKIVERLVGYVALELFKNGSFLTR